MTRYVAFLSYSHRNKAETEWLHRALERYSIPKKLVGRETARGKVPAPMIAQVRLWALPLFCGRAAHLPTA